MKAKKTADPKQVVLPPFYAFGKLDKKGQISCQGHGHGGQGSGKADPGAGSSTEAGIRNAEPLGEECA